MDFCELREGMDNFRDLLELGWGSENKVGSPSFVLCEMSKAVPLCAPMVLGSPEFTFFLTNSQNSASLFT